MMMMMMMSGEEKRISLWCSYLDREGREVLREVSQLVKSRISGVDLEK